MIERVVLQKLKPIAPYTITLSSLHPDVEGGRIMGRGETKPLTTVRNRRVHGPATSTLHFLWDHAEENPVVRRLARNVRCQTAGLFSGPRPWPVPQHRAVCTPLAGTRPLEPDHEVDQGIRVFGETTNSLSVPWDHADGPVQQHRIIFSPTVGDPVDEYVIHALSALFHSGPEVYGILWKVIIVVAAFWGVFDFLVFIWRTILAVKPPVYQVTLKQITEKIKTVEKENRKLEENLSAWEPKEYIQTMERVNDCLNGFIQSVPAKLQAARDQNAKRPHSPGILKTRSEGSMQRAMTTEECNLEEGKKKMQDHHAASGSLKEGEEDNFQKYVKKVRVLDEIGGQRNMDTGGKVDMNGCELVGKQQLLAADERAKLAEEKTQLYKLRLEECHGQMREAEITWRHQVALAEKKAQDSLLRAQELERENSELRRENSQLRRENSELRREDDELQREVAHLKQRLDATCRRRQVEEYMRQEPTPGGPHRLHPPLRASGPGGAPVRNGPAFPAQEAEETQVTVEAREPPPFAGPARVASPISCPVPPFWGYWPPPPGPVPWPLGPQPQPPMSPLGSGPGAAPVRNDSTCPPAAAVEAQVTLCGGGPEPFQGPCHVGFPMCGPVCGLTSPSGAPAPGPPGCPAQPHPPPAAAPLDGVSVRHFGEERGEGSSSPKEERASEPEATKAESKKTPRKKKRNKKRQRVSGTVDAAPQELTDHNTLTSVGGAHAADTLDGVSVRHFGEERGEGSSSAKEERASEPEATKAESKKTPRKKKRNKKRQRVSGTVDAAPQELTDHNTLTSVGGAHAADTLADMGPGAAPVWPGNASPPAAAPEAQVPVNSRRPGTCPGPPGVPCPPGTPSTNSQMVFITATPTPPCGL
ncbi:uncharacterized protein [Vicugna pacos]|uniref:Uncharacterized protein n=1 Tax=Vicugna pacos TaxID=30538 RepID=A0ABM5E9V8_VICPA